MAKLSARHAAIAQPVERILGKDEVASSNLASSSKKERPLIRVVFSFFAMDRFEKSNAARTSAAGDGSTEPNLDPRTFPCADANKSG